MGNGIKGGCESIIHSLRDISKSMDTSKFVILALDASNGYNNIDREKTLNVMHKNLPGLYLSSLNAYGQKSYIVLNDEITSVEQGSCQGCPLAQTFFNVGISQIIDYVEIMLWGLKYGIVTMVFYGLPEEAMKFWKLINVHGPDIGYYPNSKSMVYDLNIDNNNEWTEAGLSFSYEGI